MMYYLLIGLIMGLINVYCVKANVEKEFEGECKVWIYLCDLWIILLNVVLWPITLLEYVMKIINLR